MGEPPNPTAHLLGQGLRFPHLLNGDNDPRRGTKQHEPPIIVPADVGAPAPGVALTRARGQDCHAARPGRARGSRSEWEKSERGQGARSKGPAAVPLPQGSPEWVTPPYLAPLHSPAGLQSPPASLQSDPRAAASDLTWPPLHSAPQSPRGSGSSLLPRAASLAPTANPTLAPVPSANLALMRAQLLSLLPSVSNQPHCELLFPPLWQFRA